MKKSYTGKHTGADAADRTSVVRGSDGFEHNIGEVAAADKWGAGKRTTFQIANGRRKK